MNNLTLTDAAGTPVDHTFVPSLNTIELAAWQETGGGIIVGIPVATLAMRINGNNTCRVTGKLTLPVLETESGDGSELGFEPAPQVAYELIGSFEFVMPARAVLQNRKDLRAMLADYMSDAVITAAVENFVRPT